MGTAKPSTSRRAFVLRVLAGPAAFAAVLAVPLTGLAPEAHVALGGYAWIVAWWVTTPVPWGVTSFLPFVLLPIGAEMRLTEVAATYGHVIVPYLIGVMLFGHANAGASGLQGGAGQDDEADAGLGGPLQYAGDFFRPVLVKVSVGITEQEGPVAISPASCRVG